MGSRIWLLATVAAPSLTLAGCSGGAEDSTAEDAEGAEPAVGTCWAVPPDDLVTSDYLFDDSPTVPCTEPHTTETVQVLQLTDLTVSEAISEAITEAAACWDRVRVHVGVDADHWVPWNFAVVLPSREQMADGASWLRCDAVFPADWGFGSARTTTFPAAGVAIDPPDELWACLDEHPKRSKQPFVPCDQPHRYEQTGTLAILDDLDEYPQPAELAAAARRQCAYAVHAENGDVSVTARWDPPEVLQGSTSIAGACFMFYKNGQPLPPRP